LGVIADDIAPVLHPNLFYLKVFSHFLITAGASQDLNPDLPLLSPMATSKSPTCGRVKIPQATVGE
jgi:hypothetical protein